MIFPIRPSDRCPSTLGPFRYSTHINSSSFWLKFVRCWRCLEGRQLGLRGWMIDATWDLPQLVTHSVDGSEIPRPTTWEVKKTWTSWDIYHINGCRISEPSTIWPQIKWWLKKCLNFQRDCLASHIMSYLVMYGIACTRSHTMYQQNLQDGEVHDCQPPRGMWTLTMLRIWCYVCCLAWSFATREWTLWSKRVMIYLKNSKVLKDVYQHPPMGWCLNPKGLLNGTLSHQFGTPWRVQVSMCYSTSSHIPVRCSFGVRLRSRLTMMVEIAQVSLFEEWQVLAKPWEGDMEKSRFHRSVTSCICHLRRTLPETDMENRPSQKETSIPNSNQSIFGGYVCFREGKRSNFLVVIFSVQHLDIDFQKACTRLRSPNVAEAIRCVVFFVSTSLVGDLIEVIGI